MCMTCFRRMFRRVKSRKPPVSRDADALRHQSFLAHQALILVGLLAVLALGAGGTAQAASQDPRVIVSLTFDDGYAEHVAAARLLTANGLRGTFFIPSGFVGTDGYMTVDDLRSLGRDGHEIGGHTVTHPHLTTMSRDEALRQICNDRANLTGWGFSVTSFAYPFAATDAQAEDAAKTCGYNSARGLDDVRTRFSCPDCDYAETLPPANYFHTAAPQDAHNTWTLQDLKDTVTNAMPGGGWVQETFHRIGPNSADPLNVSQDVFDAFIVWLAHLQATGVVNVRTVHEVIGGTERPLVPAAPAPLPAAGVNMLKNPGLEESTKDGPACWQIDSYGVNSSALTTTSPGHSGAAAATLTVSDFGSGDVKIMPSMDLGQCSPTTTAGHAYSLKGWYKSTASARMTVFYRTGLGFWHFWCDSPDFPPATEYKHAEWTTPALPEGASAVSFGLSLSSNGAITSDDYEMYDLGVPAAQGSAAPAPPATGGVFGDHLYDGMAWLEGLAVLAVAARVYYVIPRPRIRWHAKTRDVAEADRGRHKHLPAGDGLRPVVSRRNLTLEGPHGLARSSETNNHLSPGTGTSARSRTRSNGR